MRDLIDREKLSIICYTDTEGREDTFDEGVRWVLEKIDEMPNVSMEEFEWCHDCREYDQEKHCCPRWTKVIRQTVEEMKTDGYAPLKHGHWILDDDGLIICSECEEHAPQKMFIDIKDLSGRCYFVKTPYCPDCGAKMDEGEG